MPTYEYVCPAGHAFERFERKISDKSRAKCPECGKMAQRTITGGAGLLFKGSGFYITDYKKGAAPKDGSKPDTAGKEPKPAEGAKGAAKPESGPKKSGGETS